MFFNSATYFLFLGVVFLAYWAIGEKRFKVQNIFIIFVSYFFYGCWDWRFLFLIVISSITDYLLGLALHQARDTRKRKVLLVLSLGVNLGILFTFKYFGFFVDSFIHMVSKVGIYPDINTIKFILPVGISFYTFQTLSYTIDIYRRKMEPTADPFAFFAFVAFFPQLVAGPIERASNLLPQFLSPRRFNSIEAKDGLRRILWGLFKKAVIADNLSGYVEMVFSGYQDANSLSLALGACCFGIQIYCDFSGYSDIAIGSAKLLGIKLKTNFLYPYFSRNVVEFWRRWHISLSTWFRDYVYIPLGGSRSSIRKWIISSMATFVVSGLWHGANMTFVAWGGIHGLFFVSYRLVQKKIPARDIIAEGSYLPSFGELIQISITFSAVSFAWIFFRAESFSEAAGYIGCLLTNMNNGAMIPGIVTVFLKSSVMLFGIEYLNRKKEYGLDVSSLPGILRWAIYYAIILMLMKYGVYGHIPFIYFQF